MRHIVTTLAAAVLVAGLGTACSSAADKTQPAGDTSVGDDSSADQVTDDETTEPNNEYVAPEIDGTFRHSCDYLIGKWDSWYKLVADATLRNTGNVGTIDEVTAKWYLAGGQTITETERVRSKPGQTKRVGFEREASEEEIDRIMTLHMDDMKICDVKVTTVDTFGDPQG